MKKIRIAYIGYVCEQNQPSSPGLGEVTLGNIKEDLKQIWVSAFGSDPVRRSASDYNANKITIETTNWGDIEVDHSESEDMHLYVTFDPKYKAQALEELGIKE